jgi:S1-C subfamily serine protease
MYLSISHKYEKAASAHWQHNVVNVEHPLQNTTRSLRRTNAVLSPKQGTLAAGDMYDNIVLVKVRFATFNRLMPWQTVRATFQRGLELASEAQASGLILERGLILTSAYVATDTHMLTVQRQGESKEYQAAVVVAAQDLDIALLQVDDADFWHRRDVNVSFEVEKHITGRGHKVIVAGFPIGGDFSISKLSSRVSRVVTDQSGYGGRYSTFPQIGLSLYPKVGNGITVGPVFRERDNALVGFIGRGDKVVPVQTLASFVKAYKKDNAWAGLGMLGLMVRPMLSPAMRMYWDLPEEDVGVQVRSVDPLSQLRHEGLGDDKVEKGDVLVAIDGISVHANGAVIHRNTIDNFGTINDVALPFHVVLAQKSVGDKVRLSFRRSVEREGNERGEKGYEHSRAFDIDVIMNRSKPLAQRTLDAHVMEQPTYFIVGGLVWTVLSESLALHAKLDNGMTVHMPPATLAAAFHRWREHKDEEVIVLLRSLEHPCNKWYGLNTVRILKYVNGKAPINMKQFVTEVGKILSKGETLSFTFDALDDEDAAGSESDPDVVLDTGLCAGADKALMGIHQIPTPASMNLREEYSSVPKTFTQFYFPRETPTGGEPLKAHIQKPQSTRWSTQMVRSSDNTGRDNPNEVEHALQQLPWANVVQILLVAADPDFVSPWKTKPPKRSRCSAIIVDKVKRLILTNSHCVSNAKSLDILREDAPVPVPARVLEIARDVDLAMITTDDDSFWANENIQEVVSMDEELPYISHPVRVVGYPAGGSSVTITQGIVSRIDGQIYPNGLQRSARNAPDNLLIVQVDAAVNPGNSGGPVFDSYSTP